MGGWRTPVKPPADANAVDIICGDCRSRADSLGSSPSETGILKFVDGLMDPGGKQVRRLRNNGSSAPGEPATAAESLEYLSDMIGQLRVLAERAGYPALAGLLDRAYREATARRERE
jgi:hypothetical protein